MSNPVKLFANVLKEFHDDSKWDGAILGKIKIISNTKVGSVGQRFIEKLCDELSIPWDYPKNAQGERLTQSSWDIKIYNIRFELKTATEDTNNHFQFNHVRYHREYEGILCLGVSPADLYFDVWSKGDISTGKAGSLVTMEKGANASYKLTKSPKDLHNIVLFKPTMEKFSKKFRRLNKN